MRHEARRAHAGTPRRRLAALGGLAIGVAVAGVLCSAATWAGPVAAETTPATVQVPDSARAAPPESVAVAPGDTRGAPVLFRGNTLYQILLPLGPYTPSDRAAAVSERLDTVAARAAARMALDDTDTITSRVDVGPLSSDVVLDQIVVATVTDDDALAAGQARDSLAAMLADSLRAATGRAPPAGLGDFATGLLKTLLAAGVLVLFLTGLGWAFRRLYASLEAEQSRWIRTIRIQRLELISAARLRVTIRFVARFVRVVVTIGALYFFIPLVLSFFPLTAGLAERLVQLVLDPLRETWTAFSAYVVEDLFTILVILGVMYYALKVVRLLFEGIRTRRIRISGFYTDWAAPTYQIVRFLGIVLAVILIWPHLPMSDSRGFQGVAAFLGLLVTFGSASAISNVVGGVVLIYMRAFQIGDRVQIADTVGDVIEKGLLVTRIRTPKNVNVTIPNSMVLGNHLINYSRAALQEGVVLHTTVTLGYDAPWPEVYKALEGAAAKTGGLMEEPAPFVLQKSLDDFYVAYELNVYTHEPNRAERIYSELHQNIQDACNEAGIEILSPHFRGLRDGNTLQVPASAIPKEYKAPGFRIQRMDGGEG